MGHLKPSFGNTLPLRGGVSLKADHLRQILEEQPDIGFFEVHAENYLGAGGPPHRYLEAIRANYPLSVHGVGLSIGGSDRLDRHHLTRLAALCDRYQPNSFSEHLAWSTHDGVYLNDLLPLPYTRETLRNVCDHVDEAQEVLGRTILIENPSTYVTFPDQDLTETEFLRELALRTGCGLLLDVTNVHVSCTNSGTSAAAYLAAFPYAHVGEIHLAGHDTRVEAGGTSLLIDTHDRDVSDAVLTFYAVAIGYGGPVATLIEWDSAIPELPVLIAQAGRAEHILFDSMGALNVAA
ncbi:DUF692 domain-containing protein [soil metagenome]